MKNPRELQMSIRRTARLILHSGNLAADVQNRPYLTCRCTVENLTRTRTEPNFNSCKTEFGKSHLENALKYSFFSHHCASTSSSKLSHWRLTYSFFRESPPFSYWICFRASRHYRLLASTALPRHRVISMRRWRHWTEFRCKGMQYLLGWFIKIRELCLVFNSVGDVLISNQYSSTEMWLH